MSLKYCSKCDEPVEQIVMKCPNCGAESFNHQKPGDLTVESKQKIQSTSLGSESDNEDFKAEASSTFRRVEPSESKKYTAGSSLDDEQKEKFEERLAKEIEDAKYAKWKSEQFSHSITPKKFTPNSKVRVGTWITFAGAMILIAFGNTLYATLTDPLGLIITVVGLGILFTGLAEERKKRKEMGI